jgi:hypothetical protein
MAVPSAKRWLRLFSEFGERSPAIEGHRGDEPAAPAYHGATACASSRSIPSKGRACRMPSPDIGLITIGPSPQDDSMLGMPAQLVFNADTVQLDSVDGLSTRAFA